MKHHFFFVKEKPDEDYYDKMLCLVVDGTVQELLIILMKLRVLTSPVFPELNLIGFFVVVVK